MLPNSIQGHGCLFNALPVPFVLHSFNIPPPSYLIRLFPTPLRSDFRFFLFPTLSFFDLCFLSFSSGIFFYIITNCFVCPFPPSALSLLFPIFLSNLFFRFVLIFRSPPFRLVVFLSSCRFPSLWQASQLPPLLVFPKGSLWTWHTPNFFPPPQMAFI